MSINASRRWALHYKALTVRPLAVTVIAALSFLLLPSLPANAQNIVTNGSFETGNFTGVNPGGDADITQLFSGATNITGWSVSSRDIAWMGNATPYGALASDGNRSLYLSGYSNNAPYGAVQQSVSLIPGRSYRLGFDVGWSAYSPASPVRLTATATSSSATFSNFALGTSANRWQRFELPFTATQTATVVSFQGAADSVSNGHIGLDNVTLIAVAAPEPGSWALLGFMLPLAGLIMWRRSIRA